MATPTSSAKRYPCENCGEPLYPTETSCWKCGAAQKKQATPPPSAAPGSYTPPSPRLPTAIPPYLPPPPPSSSTYQMGPSPDAQQRGTYALILGILSLFCCSLILGPIAIWLGYSAKKEGADGTATAGIVLGIIVVALSLIGVIILFGDFSAP
ncbi:MAG: hypothetical protein ACUVX8_13790 [Candidatus Zipacnadales bacterium]